MRISIITTFLMLFIISSHAQYYEDDIKSDDYLYYKMSRKEYIDKYENNDTAVAIINYYFDRRQKGISKMCVLPAPLMIGLFGTPFLVVSSAISVPIFISGITDASKYSRKKLFMILESYNKTKSVPEWLNVKIYE